MSRPRTTIHRRRRKHRRPGSRNRGSWNPNVGYTRPDDVRCGLPAMAAAVPMAAAMTRAFTGHADSPVAVDGERLAERARQLYSSLPPDLAQWVRMSVGVGCTPARDDRSGRHQRPCSVPADRGHDRCRRTSRRIGARVRAGDRRTAGSAGCPTARGGLGSSRSAEVIACFDDLGVPVIAPAARLPIPIPARASSTTDLPAAISSQPVSSGTIFRLPAHRRA